MNNDVVVIIAGPTASRKSALAMQLAHHLQGTIINADSMQVYREIPLITASPSAQDKSTYPHALYNYKSVCDPMSGALWHKDVLASIKQCISDNRIPIVVGGTGFYLKILEHGLSDIPTVPAQIIDDLNQQYRQDGIGHLYQRLMECDTATAAKLKPTDTQRIIRALSVHLATGHPLSYWHGQHSSSSYDRSLKFIKIYRDCERALLNHQAQHRFASMIQGGVLDEVTELMRQVPGLIVDRIKALGVQELRRYLQGVCDLETAIAETNQATRQYIKRQCTWFRYQFKPDIIFRGGTDDIQDIRNLINQIQDNR